MQNDLLDVGADLSVPPPRRGSASGSDARGRLRVGPEYTEWLEQACDEVNATLAPLRSFVIPGGTPAAAHLHVCRTVCRRAERRAIAVGEDGNAEVVRYLNRLSDLLFILSRAANNEPGAGATPSRCGSPARTAPTERRRVLAAALASHGAAHRAARRRSAEQVRAPQASAAREPRRPATASAVHSSAEQVAAEHVARHVPGADQQRGADGERERAARARRRPAAPARRRDEHGAQRERPSPPSRGRSATRPGRSCVTPTRTCGWASSGLSISALSGASASTTTTASATRGRSAREREQHERDAPRS